MKPFHPTGKFRKNELFKSGGSIPTVDALYFRLTPDYLYYSESKENTTVLGGMKVSNMDDVQNGNIDPKSCFIVANVE